MGVSFTRCRTNKSYITQKKIHPKFPTDLFFNGKTPAVLALTTAASAAAASAWFELDVDEGSSGNSGEGGQT